MYNFDVIKSNTEGFSDLNKKFTSLAFLLPLLLLVLPSYSSADIRTRSPLYVTPQEGEKFSVTLSGSVISSSIKAWDASGTVVSQDSFSGGEAVFLARPSVVRYVYTSEKSGDVTAILASDDAKLLAVCSNGIFEGKEDDDYYNQGVLEWLGVPFAEQPIGSLRWKAPQEPKPSDEKKDAKKFGPANIQESSPMYDIGLPNQAEECLNLNIWKRDDPVSTKPLPVFVFIYGGGFTNGDPSIEFPALGLFHAGAKFVKNNDGIIFVSIPYRIGVLGFIDFSGVPGGENYPDAPNLGLLDCAQALKWIHDNIAAFGGDPDNVTICGNSSGAALVSFLVTMPQVNKYIKRGIMQSGGPSMSSPKKYSMNLADKLLKATGTSNMDELLALSSADIKEASDKVSRDMAFPERDGKLIGFDPYEKLPNADSIDLLIGSNADEVNFWMISNGSLDVFSKFVSYTYDAVTSIMPEDGKTSSDIFVSNYLDGLESEDKYSVMRGMSEYLNDLLFRGPLLKAADIHSGNSSGGKTFMYYWAYPVQATLLANLVDLAAGFGYSLGIDTAILPYLKACHVAEVPYVLGNSHLLAPDPDNWADNEEYDSMLVTKTQSMWVNFAKTGNPSVPSLGISWPEYGASGQTLLISSDGSISAENFNAKNSEQLMSASSEKKTLAQRLSEQSNLISGMVDYGISGCEIINGNLQALASYDIIRKIDTESDEPSPDIPSNPNTDTQEPENTSPNGGTNVPDTETSEPQNTSPNNVPSVPNNGDTTNTPDESTPSTPITGTRSSSGGCSSGTGTLLMLAVVCFVLRRKQ